MEHLDSYLAADGIELSADVLDRIDEIVPPGVTTTCGTSARRALAASPPAVRRQVSRATREHAPLAGGGHILIRMQYALRRIPLTCKRLEDD
jgi:hypothetical protein